VRADDGEEAAPGGASVRDGEDSAIGGESSTAPPGTASPGTASPGAAVADAVAEVLAALDRVVHGLPSGGEERPSQRRMAEAVAAAFESDRHLLVQAGTGTGKSLAYLVPAILSGRTVVVATATKALQEQLVHKDLPLLAQRLRVPFKAALLKGRSNYLCLAKLGALAEPAQARLAGVDPGDRVLGEIVAWAGGGEPDAVHHHGDRAELPFAVHGRLWAEVSVDSRECPGAARCPQGAVCFAERARARAAEADVVVVNTHLLGVDLAMGGFVLPEHDLVVIDEAHGLEDVAAAAFGLEIGVGRFEHVARAAAGVFTDDAGVSAAVSRIGASVDAELARLVGERVEPSSGHLGTLLVTAGELLAGVSRQAAALDVAGAADSAKVRLVGAVDGLRSDIQSALEVRAGRVAWVESGPALRVAPVDVGPHLAASLFAHRTTVLTSATLSVGGDLAPVAWRLGLRDELEPELEGAAPFEADVVDAEAPHSLAHDVLEVASPFDYEHQALLYCPVHLPDPRASAFPAAARAELAQLIAVAGGRTLALFTSRRALDEAAEELVDVVDHEILVQDALPRPQLVERFATEEQTCLFATMGFWQGLDVPGRACSLVVIDKIPFPRPDDPLAEARRREAAARRRDPFTAVDLPRAATLLAQGAGRLIRSADDRGVVAVLDRRLGKARYAWTLVRSLPPMRRTRELADVRAFLAAGG
jgi:ATP-dependent DNA helicase DinG